MSGAVRRGFMAAEASRQEAIRAELRALKYLDGLVVQVGKASQEIAHGEPIWLCQTQPPHTQRFMPVSSRSEAIDWLRRECGAEEIVEGVLVA